MKIQLESISRRIILRRVISSEEGHVEYTYSLKCKDDERGKSMKRESRDKRNVNNSKSE